MPAEIKRSPYTFLSATGLFMNKVPLEVKFKFDLLKYRTGQFSAEVHMDTLDRSIVNPIAEPLGRFTVKSGQMQKAIANVSGDNYNTSGSIDFYYTDLHLTPLKSDRANGQLKRNHIKSFFANIILKNKKPKENELRKPEYIVGRDYHLNFVAYIWTTILTGICKTISIPPRLVIKKQ
jgi:hypothetical protein